MDHDPDCFYCAKHRAGTDAPPGGWLVDDELWLVGHGPAAMSMAGAVRIEARRHFVDFAGMTDDEARSFGPLLERLYAAMLPATGAERIHLLATMDFQPHFHAWLYPRRADEPDRGTTFIHQARSCSPEAAEAAATAIRAELTARA